MTPEFEKALRRIFRLCDEDRDNLLSEHEITQFQEKCFGVRLGKDEIQRLFQVRRRLGVSLSILRSLWRVVVDIAVVMVAAAATVVCCGACCVTRLRVALLHGAVRLRF